MTNTTQRHTSIRLSALVEKAKAKQHATTSPLSDRNKKKIWRKKKKPLFGKFEKMTHWCLLFQKICIFGRSLKSICNTFSHKKPIEISALSKLGRIF
jgi:hypothetical protein